MDYAPYPHYCDSGIEWLGNIPDHWQVVSAKLSYEIQLGKMLQNDSENFTDMEVNYLKALHVTWSGVKTGDLPMMWASLADLKKYSVNDGDLLICEGGEVGRASILKKDNDEPWVIQNALHRVRSSSLANVEYFNYLLRHIADSGWFDILCNKATIAHLTGEKLGALKVSIPSLTEQATIARFLDHKTQQIDQLIAQKQTLIGKLNEQRIALITHAVTKGLNPDVKMKDSGVEWLGEVPEHWKVSKLGYFSESLQTGPFGSQIHAEEYIDGGIPLINPAEIINGTLRYNPRVSVDDATAERLKRHQLIEGDIVIGRRGEMGRAGLTKKENVGWLCGTGSLRARLETDKLMPEYLLQLFSLAGTADYLSLQSVGSTMDNLNTSILDQLPIIIPPIEEQREIVEYLDRETARIDRLVELNQQTIDKLKEYRTALITAAVTGKIDVRNWRQEANHANP